jgi:hypothetical protein
MEGDYTHLTGGQPSPSAANLSKIQPNSTQLRDRSERARSAQAQTRAREARSVSVFTKRY